MANQDDIDRWKKGKDHWNKWAKGRLKAKEKLKKEGKWEIEYQEWKLQGLNNDTRRWISSASIDFSRHVFPTQTNFEGFIFPGEAIFVETKFEDQAFFDEAKFFGPTIFAAAQFRSNAWFSKIEFHDVFLFIQTNFMGITEFEETKFKKFASFRSIISDGVFSLEKASFLHVPDFTQSSFRAPARLDHLEVVQTRGFQVSGDAERAAYYRALKKIAIDTHDHVREQEFFASELRERRGHDDPIGSPAWLFSFPYELFSDFGRSISRPLGWLLISLLTFAAITGTGVKPEWLEAKECSWQSNWLLPEIYLSFLHSLPIIGFGRGEKREQALTCLFGSIPDVVPAKAGVSPAWDMLFIMQNIWSAVLIFLFLLAVRNHFRIK